jgi:hypothetical protein
MANRLLGGTWSICSRRRPSGTSRSGGTNGSAQPEVALQRQQAAVETIYGWNLPEKGQVGDEQFLALSVRSPSSWKARASSGSGDASTNCWR